MLFALVGAGASGEFAAPFPLPPFRPLPLSSRMFSSRQFPGIFLDHGGDTVRVARTSAFDAPFTVEEAGECAAGDRAGLAQLLQRLSPRRSGGRRVHARVAIRPEGQLVRVLTAEPKRLGEPDYFAALCSGQLQIDPQTHLLSVLQAEDGRPFDVARTGERELFFCGLPLAELEAAQGALVDQDIYPESLELGTVATLGAVVDHARHAALDAPVLVLELGGSCSHAYVVSGSGVSLARPLTSGLDAMVPLVQRNLGLKDVAAAKKLLFANAFDFSAMGPELTQALAREVQALISYHEVQTGRSVGCLLNLRLPTKLGWLGTALARELGLETLVLAMEGWLGARGVSVAPAVRTTVLPDPGWLGVWGLMLRGEVQDAGQAA